MASTIPAPPYSFSSTMVTPQDYHKLASSVQLPLPEYKFVGLLACQRESILSSDAAGRAYKLKERKGEKG